ncbi:MULTISPECIES: TIGR01459 family HAD-type hydrolase [Alphaproteobacteria]|uniref:Haloacid dehalogenase n=2 Tax=Alphaproteobacteria TaxID=28211 RepID=A0A512HI38_9HYPH|nr:MULTISPECIES: TIGR01459 family HAD-type hydrolase [Alphaproteobacteria]GEO85113.1 haloacid dehalogenase [Ciceribacter naphthalenivorans]GLR24553.1 haloacid dehalogenase [Ciceribacter naphthalenivorans]GLT07409.1 haloacid dehalogenase [Sphingomonas psychrolutea]
MAERISTLSDVTERYDVILCDVWGVLHNGIDAFPAASEALTAARAAGVTVVLITNSPRRSQDVISQLRMIGVADTAYDRIVTSGDVTRTLIAAGPKKVFFLGPDRDLNLLDGLDVVRVSAEEAEAIVCTGFFDDETEVPEDYHDMLTVFAARKAPLICANPDLIVERGSRMIPCAGAVAAYYQQLGGETRIAGKPHAPIYAASLAAASDHRHAEPGKGRVLAIGDGMPTDVRGALNAGLDLLYISGGIHAAEYTVNGRPDEAILNAYLKRENAEPQYWMQRLA